MRRLITTLAAVAVLAGACSSDGGRPSGASDGIPDGAFEVDYGDIDQIAKDIEDDETGAVWYRIDYQGGTEPTFTYLKVTDGAAPLALTFGDCGIAAASYPAEQEQWFEFCY